MIIGLMIFFSITAFFILYKSYHIVPQKQVYIVERLGKYQRTLHAGFNLVIPLLERIAYKHSLKETVVDVPIQVCITRDNIAVEVDGVLYIQVVDPEKASYGINDYLFATTQISQTTMRSIIGKLDLDQTFEERENINAQILEAADKASDPWGIKVTRYEIKDIKPPKSIKDAMEKQMRAEREKRAVIAASEGDKQSQINRAEGDQQRRMLEAKAKGYEILETAKATAEGISRIADAIQHKKGQDAITLRLAEQYLIEFGKMAKTNNTMIIPSNMSDISSVISTATSIYQSVSKEKEKDLLTKLKDKTS
ncbi:MAG: stomatin-like protein [Chlamydiota bacterium]|jgi:regulator of protease activity HflC (stomatin/prohibitin superfamily)